MTHPPNHKRTRLRAVLAVTVALSVVALALGSGACTQVRSSGGGPTPGEAGSDATPVGDAPADVQPVTALRGPVGVYAYVDVEGYSGRPADQDAGYIDTYLGSLYATLLASSTISGLDLNVHWATLNPNDPSNPDAGSPYNWAPVDLAFEAAAAWNTANPNAPKNIQLNIIPGFESPSWIFANMAPCDPPDPGLSSDGGTPFMPAPPATPPTGQTCDYSYFLEIEGKIAPYVSRPLPMPWSQTYRGYWGTFLAAVAGRYGDNPALASIAIGGPTATSTEMIVPHNPDIDPTTMAPPYATQWQSDLVHWNYLFQMNYGAGSAYLSTDQAFIDGWTAAIDMYGQTFSHITLIATTGDGLPDFPPAAADAGIPPAFFPACPNPNMDCAAQATILSYFLQPGVGGNNAKAVEEEGFTAGEARQAINFDSTTMKWLAAATSGTYPMLGGGEVSRVLGGLECNTVVSNEMNMGCLDTTTCADADPPTQRCDLPCAAASCPVTVICADPDSGAPPGPEQSLYNVIQAYFASTPNAEMYGADAGPGPFNFFQIYAQDVFYALGMNGCTSKNFVAQAADAGDGGLASCAIPPPGSVVVAAGGVSSTMTSQGLLQQANTLLPQIAEPAAVCTGTADCDGGICANGLCQ